MKLLKNVFKANQRGMLHLHIVLPVLLAVMAVGGIGAYVLSSSHAGSEFVCKIGPEFKDVAGTADGGVNDNSAQWYSVVIHNQSGAATGTLNDLAFQGMSPDNSKVLFTWNAQSYNNQYVDWLKGFSGVAIMNNATVQGQVRKPTSPTGVTQNNWTLVVKGKSYKCGTTTNINSEYTNLTKTTPVAALPAPTTPAPTPAPTTPTPAPTPAPTTPPVYTGKFSCTVGQVLITPASTGSVPWYPITITNNTDKATTGLSEINFFGQAPTSSFTWNAVTNKDYFIWESGFSGASIPKGATVKGQIRKPSTPTGVDPEDWTLKISNVSYKCSVAATAGSTTPAPSTTVYTSLPSAPANNSLPYVSWKAWSDGVTANKALTGQALIDKLKPLKDAYDADVRVVVSTTCKPVFPATITFGEQVKSSLDVTSKLTTSVPANAYMADLTEKYSDAAGPTAINGELTSALAANGTVKVNTTSHAYQKSATKRTVTLSYKLVRYTPYNPVISNCTDSYKTYDLTTGKETATPVADKPAAVVVVGNPPVTTKPTPGTKKIADLGYSAVLYCVTKDKAGKLTVSKCASANAIVLAVKGASKDPAKNKLSYGVDVTKTTTDKFGTATGCAARTLYSAGKELSYDCTVLYTNQSFFTGMKSAVMNRFNSIIKSASAQTFLNKSEAKAAITQLQKVDLVTLDTRITLSYPKYTPQVIDGPNLVLDYDEAASVQRIKNIQEADCKAAGGTFISTADGCDLSSGGSGSSGSSSGSASTSSLTKAKCDSLGRVWSNNSCLKQCSSSANKLVTDEPYDVCIKKTSTKPTCKAGTHLKNFGSDGWACIANDTTASSPKAITCSGKGGMYTIGSTYSAWFGWRQFKVNPPASAVPSYSAFKDQTCMAVNHATGSVEYSLPTYIW